MEIVPIIPKMIPLLTELRQWLQDRNSSKRAQADVNQQKLKEQREEEKGAIKALLDALTKTHIYLNDLESGMDSNRDREIELAKAWSTAAVSFLGINQKVAPLLQMKSEVWAHPESWSDKRVRKSKITIQEMSELARKLLGGENRSGDDS